MPSASTRARFSASRAIPSPLPRWSGWVREQAQVVVGRALRVAALEPVEQLEDLIGPGRGQLAEQRLDPLLLVLGQLGSLRRDPDRDRRVVALDPDPRIAQSAGDVEAPPGLEVLGLGEGPAPDRVLREGGGQSRGDPVEVALGRDAGGHLSDSTEDMFGTDPNGPIRFRLDDGLRRDRRRDDPGCPVRRVPRPRDRQHRRGRGDRLPAGAPGADQPRRLPARRRPLHGGRGRVRGGVPRRLRRAPRRRRRRSPQSAEISYEKIANGRIEARATLGVPATEALATLDAEGKVVFPCRDHASPTATDNRVATATVH